ncbi:2-oxoadipate dioxygenase/decarboxylase family protein [Flagellimonas sp. 2504JD4-2]
MKFDDNTPLDIILKSIFNPYKRSVADVEAISCAMINKGLIGKEEDIINDHIAFRTLGVPNLGIASLEKIFLAYGYRRKEAYYFQEKKLDAYWYAPPHPKYPRIFISELRVQELPQNAQTIIKKYTAHITKDPVDSLDFASPKEVGEFFYQPLWDVPSLDEFLELAKATEYAAWVIYNRYYLNHYTISVHALPEPYNTLKAFNSFLEEIGIVLNTAGGKIKISKDGLLKQSSSVAKMVNATFANGEQMKIAGSYVEFAERLPLPEFQGMPKTLLKQEHLREGFESANADKIFESTYDEQVKKAVNCS